MAIREFTDRKGDTWRVWETRPSTSRLRPQFREGWLTFEHDDVRRRLSPIPDGWADADELELRRLFIESALEVPRARRLE